MKHEPPDSLFVCCCLLRAIHHKLAGRIQKPFLGVDAHELESNTNTDMHNAVVPPVPMSSYSNRKYVSRCFQEQQLNETLANSAC